MGMKQLILRGDDLGVTHAANEGFRRYAEKGVMSAWSIMAPCPWFSEAVELAKEFPNVDVGMHLTLMSEWRGYRWGPVLGAACVPSLVDKNGYFPTNPLQLLAGKPVREEVEAELRGQIERVLNAGLNLLYIDNSHGNICHMLPMVNEVANRLIEEYKLQASPFVFDPTLEIISASASTVEAKKEAYFRWLKTPQVIPGYRFVVVHPMLDHPEARALRLPPEMDVPFLQEIIFHNIADTQALATDEFAQTLKDLDYEIIHYHDMPEGAQHHRLEVWPPEILAQMFSMMGASPETIEQVVSMSA